MSTSLGGGGDSVTSSPGSPPVIRLGHGKPSAPAHDDYPGVAVAEIPGVAGPAEAPPPADQGVQGGRVAVEPHHGRVGAVTDVAARGAPLPDVPPDLTAGVGTDVDPHGTITSLGWDSSAPTGMETPKEEQDCRQRGPSAVHSWSRARPGSRRRLFTFQ